MSGFSLRFLAHSGFSLEENLFSIYFKLRSLQPSTSLKLFFHLLSKSVLQNQTISQFINIFLLKDIRRKEFQSSKTKKVCDGAIRDLNSNLLVPSLK